MGTCSVSSSQFYHAFDLTSNKCSRPYRSFLFFLFVTFYSRYGTFIVSHRWVGEEYGDGGCGEWFFRLCTEFVPYLFWQFWVLYFGFFGVDFFTFRVALVGFYRIGLW